MSIRVVSTITNQRTLLYLVFECNIVVEGLGQLDFTLEMLILRSLLLSFKYLYALTSAPQKLIVKLSCEKKTSTVSII